MPGSGTTTPTKLLDFCYAQAATLPTLVCSEGKRRLAESENLENLVRALPPQARGYLGAWIEETQRGNVTNPGEIVIQGLLLVRVSKDVTSDMVVAYDLVEAVAQLWGDESTLAIVGSQRPDRLRWTQVGDNLEDDVVGFEITARYKWIGCG